MLQMDPSWLKIDAWLIAVIVICVVAFIVFAAQRAIRAHRDQVSAGREDLVGKVAEVVIALEPKGIVFIEGERWTAISEKGRVEPGEEVTVTKVDGLKLFVTKKE